MMKKTVLSSVMFLMVATLIFSCKSDSSIRDQAKAALSEEEVVDQQTETLDDAMTEDVLEGPTTSIKFKETEYEYGTVTSGDVVTHEFTFENTGKEPLTLKNVRASCGCTTPEWPKEPIMPGEVGVIKAEFNTAGKSGNQVKTITVTANTNPVNTELVLKGDVLKKDGEEKAS